MQLIANSVMSRRPSSRRSSGMKFEPDAAQTFTQEVRLAAKPQAQVAFEPQMRARHDQHAVFFADTFGQLITGRRGVVLHEAERAGLRFAERQEAVESVRPFAHNGQILLQDRARARVELFAVLHGYSRDDVRDLVGSDGEVIVLCPAIGDDVGWPDDPSDPHAGNSVRLRKAAGDNDAIAHSPETAGAFAIDLGAEVNFI